MSTELKTCDLCGERDLKVYFDASIPTHRGRWANVCHVCFLEHNCKLGLGRGQQFIFAEGKYRKFAG